MVDIWWWWSGARRAAEEREASQDLTIANMALQARRRELEERLGERDKRIAETIANMLPEHDK